MTIVYVLKMYPRFSETFVVNEILELERQGVDVRIYSLYKPNDGRFHAHLARVRASVVYLPEYIPPNGNASSPRSARCFATTAAAIGSPSKTRSRAEIGTRSNVFSKRAFWRNICCGTP